MIVALAGRRIDADGASPPRFPARNVDMVSHTLRRLFEREGATALVSSAACGADLLALRVAGALGLRRRLVLPFDRAAFRSSSVVDRPGDWGPLYDRVLGECEPQGDVVTLDQPPGDAAYAATNAAILDEAQALARAAGEPLVALLVWDGVSRGEGDLTADFGAAAAARGIAVREVPTTEPSRLTSGGSS